MSFAVLHDRDRDAPLRLVASLDELEAETGLADGLVCQPTLIPQESQMIVADVVTLPQTQFRLLVPHTQRTG